MAEQAEQVPMQEVYVGPRPFERSERGLFFGRDREISELLSLVVSSRVVLCFAPSGAGKTSLVNAGLLPRLEQEGFEVLPIMRVRGLIQHGEIDRVRIPNIYAFNAILSLAGEEAVPGELVGRSLADFLSTRSHMNDEEGFPAPRILIFDQFEELLTSYPERWQERETFFHQVRQALQADPLLRAVFIMREDFLARIEPYMRQLKPYQYSRFRLPLLGAAGARAAVTGPLRGTGRHFKEGVVDALIEELLKVRVETAQGEAVEVAGENVEPVQLQVVCRNLWMSLPPDVQEISHEHLEAYGDVDQALQSFYESCLAEARSKQDADELNLRQWFEKQLITPAGTRGIVFRDARLTAGLPNPIVDFMENRHLIRGEWRAGSRWYELTHDRFIEPIQVANQRWRSRRQARRNRWLIAGAVTLLLALALLPTFLNAPGPSSQVGESTVVAAQTSVSQAEVAVQVAQEDATLSRSRQLAAQALLQNDPQLALLLAIEANQQKETLEARRSLHQILSRQAVIDGDFLREFDPEILSPKTMARLEGHKNWIESVAFSPDGKQIVSGSKDTTLIIWDVATGKPVGPPLSGHNSEVWSVAFSPTSNMIASGGLDGQILLWDASTRERIDPPLITQTSWITSLAFSPDGKSLASGDGNGIIRIWNVFTRELLAVVEAHKGTVWSLAWSPDGKVLASGSADSMIGLWNIATTASFSDVRFLSYLSGHHGQVWSLAWSPDGRRLASGSVIERVRQTGGEAILWDVEAGKAIVWPLLEENEPVRTIAFDPSGMTLAIGRENGTITFWDTRTEQIQGSSLKGHDSPVMCLAFSPDGRYLVSGSIDKTIVLWDLSAPTRSLAFNLAGDTLAASQGSAISLWQLADQAAPPSILTGHTENVLALAFSPDGSHLASAGLDDSLRLWNITGGQNEPPLLGFGGAFETFRLGFSPNGKRLVSTSTNGSVLLWDMEAFTEHGPEPIYQQDGVIESSLDPSGEELYLGGRDGSLVTLDVSTGANQEEGLPGLQGQSLSNLAFSPDGKEVAFLRETGLPSVEDGGRAHGITISFWDQSFDPTINPQDIDFVLIRATQGNKMTDPKFEELYKAARAIPIRGAYHVFQPDQPWQEQADHFLSVVKGKDFQFFTLDLEIPATDKSKNFVSDAEQWLKYVDGQVEQKILIHTLPSFYQTWLSPTGDWMKDWPLLVMSYPFEPDRNGNPVLPSGVTDWKIWQYTDGIGQGAEYGVGASNVIQNVFNGTLTDMWNWLEIPTFTIYDRTSGEQRNPHGLDLAAGRNGIAFSPDGIYVAVGSDEKVTLLDVKTGNVITALPLPGARVTSLHFKPDGGALAVGTEDGTVLLWDLSSLNLSTSPEPALELACGLAKGNFTEAQWKLFLGNMPYHLTCPGQPR